MNLTSEKQNHFIQVWWRVGGWNRKSIDSNNNAYRKGQFSKPLLLKQRGTY